MGAHTILLCAYVITVSITEVACVRNVLAKHSGAVGHALSGLAPAVAGRPLSWRCFQPQQQGVDGGCGRKRRPTRGLIGASAHVSFWRDREGQRKMVTSLQREFFSIPEIPLATPGFCLCLASRHFGRPKRPAADRSWSRVMAQKRRLSSSASFS
jgi:hypothetical protein